MGKIDVRAVFTKCDRAKYISHLDLNRTMQRAFKRAGIPIWYTQGFNPHAYIMFALALSLGYESKCEIMDFAITESLDFEVIKQKMNENLPQGLQIVSVFKPQNKHTEIGKAEFIANFKSLNDRISIDELYNKFTDFISLPKIEIEKRTKKRGINLIDIKPFIEILDLKKNNDMISLTVLLPAGTELNINPSLIFDAFLKICECEIDFISVERTKILCYDNNIFL